MQLLLCWSCVGWSREAVSPEHLVPQRLQTRRLAPCSIGACQQQRRLLQRASFVHQSAETAASGQAVLQRVLQAARLVHLVYLVSWRSLVWYRSARAQPPHPHAQLGLRLDQGRCQLSAHCSKGSTSLHCCVRASGGLGGCPSTVTRGIRQQAAQASTSAAGDARPERPVHRGAARA